MEEKKTNTTISRDMYTELRYAIRKDFEYKEKRSTTLEKGKLIDIYCKQLNIPDMPLTALTDAFKAEGITIVLPSKKERTIYASDYVALEQKVQLLEAKLSDLETAIQNLPN